MFFELRATDVAHQRGEQDRRKAASAVKQKDTIVVKFRFDHTEIRDVLVQGTFGTKEPTCKLFEYLNGTVFNEGTVFTLTEPGAGKRIQSTKNQRLIDVKVKVNAILLCKVSTFTGFREEIASLIEEEKQRAAAQAQSRASPPPE
jgi:hypothetical protein